LLGADAKNKPYGTCCGKMSESFCLTDHTQLQFHQGADGSVKANSASVPKCGEGSSRPQHTPSAQILCTAITISLFLIEL